MNDEVDSFGGVVSKGHRSRVSRLHTIEGGSTSVVTSLHVIDGVVAASVGGTFEVDVVVEFVSTIEFHVNTSNGGAADQLSDAAGELAVARHVNEERVRSGMAGFAFVPHGSDFNVVTIHVVRQHAIEEVLFFSDEVGVDLGVLIHVLSVLHAVVEVEAQEATGLYGLVAAAAAGELGLGQEVALVEGDGSQ